MVAIKYRDILEEVEIAAQIFGKFCRKRPSIKDIRSKSR